MNTKRIVYSGLLIAVGVLLPIIFHSIPGNLGPVMLPIHYSAFFAGGFFGPLAGAIVGLLTPVTSHLLTGMPVMPVFIYIAFETLTYGLIFGILFYHKKLNIYFALFYAMIAGRIVNICGNFIIAELILTDLAPSFSIINVINNLSIGIIGAIIQMMIIPIVVRRINIVFSFTKNRED